ncbi:MAG TPA: nuclear transport factor 2 family protein [Thermomicrobiales bacterium]|nr:nuclear transport factor 2 family protein [Thermomicrobiales bacterium]
MRRPLAPGGRTGTLAGSGGRTDRREQGRFIPAATCLLTSLTALVLLALAVNLGGPFVLGAPLAAPAPAGQATLVRAFYATVNNLLANRDDAALSDLVAPDIVAHLPDRQVSGQTALAAYWTALGRAAPGSRLAPLSIFVDGDDVAATVEPVVPASPWPDMVLEGPPARQTPTERFRIAQGRIAEYWSAIDPAALPEVVPPLPLPPLAGPTQAGLVRFSLPPHVALGDLVAAGPHLLLPRVGTLTVTVAGAAEVRRAATPETGWRATTASAALALQPGDAALIPAGVQHALRNDTGGPVLFFGVLLLPLDAAPDALSPEPLRDLYRPGADRRPIGTAGAAATWLADGIDLCAGTSPATLRIATLPLAMGQSLATHPLRGVELLASERGVALADWDQAFPGVPLPTDKAIAAGDGLGLGTGMDGRLVNAGAEPARLLLVAIGSQDATCSRGSPNDDADAAVAPRPTAAPRFARTQT